MAIEIPVWVMAAPRTVPFERRLRSSMGDALRRSCRTKATAAGARCESVASAAQKLRFARARPPAG
jgi:hypothetical protein